MQLARSSGNLHRGNIFYISPEAMVIFQNSRIFKENAIA